MAQNAQSDESIDADDLPQEVIDALPEDIRQEILDGVRDQIPEDIVETLDPGVADLIPDSSIGDAATDVAASNPALTAVIVVIGLLALAGAVWGAIKGFLKVAIGLGILAAIVWFFFFVR